MFDAGRLLGQILNDAAAGAISARRRPNRRRTSILGMGTGGIEARIGMGLIGLAVAAFEHFRQSAANSTTSPPQPATGAMPPPMPTSPPPPSPIDHERALHLVRAMICAADADGLIDAAEREDILGRAREAGLADAEIAALEGELHAPLTLAQLVARTPADLREQVYAAALISITPDTDQETQFLDQLATQLALDAQTRQGIRQQIGI